MTSRAIWRPVLVVMGALALATSCGDDPAAVDTAAVDTAAVDTTAPSSGASTEPTEADPSSTSSAPVADAESLSFTVPAGTGEKIDAGESVDVLPAELDVSIGDHITIENQDSRSHVIGPFYVAANDTMEHTFVAAGTFAGACTAHSSGEIVVVVSEA
jgi:plastocyanin